MKSPKYTMFPCLKTHWHIFGSSWIILESQASIRRGAVHRGAHGAGQSHVRGAEGLLRRNPGRHDRHLGRRLEEEKPQMLVDVGSGSWFDLETIHFLPLQFLASVQIRFRCLPTSKICNEELALIGCSLSKHLVPFPCGPWGPYGKSLR